MSSILSKFLPEGIQQYRSLSRQYRGPRRQLGQTSWPETPFKLISSTRALLSPHIPLDHYCRKNAVIMAQTHNTIFRGFNAIYHQAPLVSPGTQDAEDLLFYCMVVHDFLEAHHTAEETTYFPAIEKAAGMKGLMENNVEQHKAFEEAVWRFRVYALTTTRWTYRADELRHLIDQLAEPLEKHLHDEIPSILELHSKVDSTALERIYGDMHHMAEKLSDKWRAGPFVFGCQDTTFMIDGEHIAFPDVPAIVPYLIDYVVAPRYAGGWRFNPSSAYGKPRGLGYMPQTARLSGENISTVLFLSWLFLLLVGVVLHY